MKIRFTCPPELIDELPKPQPARRTAPDWYKAMPMNNPVEGGGVDLTIKHCMPFMDALTTGFVIPLQADITVKDGEFSWDWPHEESPLGFHFPTQAPGVPFVDEDEVVVKAHNFWSIHTEPGYATLFTHPLNRWDLPFRTLSGIVDTDSFDALPVHFPMIWVDKEFEGVLPAGTPVAQCLPIERGRAEIEVGAMSVEEYSDAKGLKDRIKDERGFYKSHIRQDRS
ncbi:MAG: hypothetical protein CMM52_07235 [Rhodospirillaceae bacterium]|nr:hypothetical protein [Rhodospirillaceae bacterium]|tara:strand:- start:24396 stop:25070 length:675 start_codon:yes stop_codon:yes gene_type:complete